LYWILAHWNSLWVSTSWSCILSEWLVPYYPCESRVLSRYVTPRGKYISKPPWIWTMLL
jgi:hypothetical protein